MDMKIKSLEMQAKQSMSININIVKQSQQKQRQHYNLISAFNISQQENTKNPLSQLDSNSLNKKYIQQKSTPNEELGFYLIKIQKLQSLLKQKNLKIIEKNNLIYQKDSVIAKLTETAENLQQQKRQKLQKDKLQQEVKQRQKTKKNSKKDEIQEHLIELQCQVQKYKKKYNIVQQALRNKTVQFENQISSLIKHNKQDKQVIKQLRQQNFQFQQQNITLEQKIQQLENFIQEFELQQNQRRLRLSQQISSSEHMQKLSQNNMKPQTWKDGGRFSFGQEFNFGNFGLNTQKANQFEGIKLKQSIVVNNEQSILPLSNYKSSIQKHSKNQSHLIQSNISSEMSSQLKNINYTRKKIFEQSHALQINSKNDQLKDKTQYQQQDKQQNSLKSIFIKQQSKSAQTQTIEKAFLNQGTITQRSKNQNLKIVKIHNLKLNIKKQLQPIISIKAHIISPNKYLEYRQAKLKNQINKQGQTVQNIKLQQSNQLPQTNSTNKFTNQKMQTTIPINFSNKNTEHNKNNLSRIRSSQNLQQIDKVFVPSQQSNKDILNRINNQLNRSSYPESIDIGITQKNKQYINFSSLQTPYKQLERPSLKINNSVSHFILQNQHKEINKTQQTKSLKSSYLQNHQKYGKFNTKSNSLINQYTDWIQEDKKQNTVKISQRSITKLPIYQEKIQKRCQNYPIKSNLQKLQNKIPVHKQQTQLKRSYSLQNSKFLQTQTRSNSLNHKDILKVNSPAIRCKTYENQTQIKMNKTQQIRQNSLYSQKNSFTNTINKPQQKSSINISLSMKDLIAQKCKKLTI